MKKYEWANIDLNLTHNCAAPFHVTARRLIEKGYIPLVHDVKICSFKARFNVKGKYIYAMVTLCKAGNTKFMFCDALTFACSRIACDISSFNNLFSRFNFNFDFVAVHIFVYSIVYKKIGQTIFSDIILGKEMQL